MTMGGLGAIPDDPLLTRALAGAAARVTAWAQGDSRPTNERLTDGLAHVSGLLLDVMARWTGSGHIPAFSAAIDRGDPTALRVLERIVSDVQKIRPTLVENLQRWVHDGAGHRITSQAPDIAALLLVGGDPSGAAQAQVIAARTFWRSDDSEQTVAMYQLAIAIAEQNQPEKWPMLGAWHDNMALALASLDRIDEAIAHYRISARLETDPDGQLSIRNNLAMAYSRIGEYALAAREQEAVCTGLAEGNPEPVKLAIAYDNWALSLLDLGHIARAVEMLDRAAGLFPRDALDDRRFNASARAYGYNALGRRGDAATAFRETWDLAVESAQRIDEEYFRDGYIAALQRLSPPDSPVWDHLLSAGKAAKDHHWKLAVDGYVTAAKAAGAVNDQLTLLRCRANIAAVLADAQQVDDASVECRRVQQAATHEGLAMPIAMTAVVMASLMRGGSDRGGPTEALMISARGLAFADLHDRLAAQANLPPDQMNLLPPIDVGILMAQVAGAAEDGKDLELAEEYYRKAISVARHIRYRYGEMNRQVGLLKVLDKMPERKADAQALEAELRDELDRGDTEPIIRLVINRCLGARTADARQSLSELSSAARLLDTLRTQVPPGGARSDLDREYGVYSTLLRRQQKYDAPAADAFASLQAFRARRLMETLTAATGDAAPYQPVGVDEIVTLLARQPRPTTFVDVTLTDAGFLCYLVDRNGLRTVDVPGDIQPVLSAQWGDAGERARDVIRLVTESVPLADLARAVTDAIQDGSTVLVAVDDPLSNLPLHAIPLRGGIWADAVSIGRIPAAGCLRFTPSDRAWTGRSIVAGDSNCDLPGAARECATVAELIGAPKTVGDACTFDAVRDALTAEPGQRFDLVHLAVHGRADVRRGGRSSLLFAGRPPSWVPFAELAALPWRAALIVFSGCSTAVGGPRNGQGLYGVAQAAAEAGATTVLASLWPVNDASTATFMTAFYDELARRRGSGLIDLRELMDHAREQLRRTLADGHDSHIRRDGRELILEGMDADQTTPEDPRISAMMQWAPFVLIGEPTMAV